MATIWSFAVCCGKFAYIHPKTTCAFFWLFLPWWALGPFQMTVLSQSSQWCPKVRALQQWNGTASMPYGSVQEHWESSRIENAISYYYHYDCPPKKRSHSPQAGSITRSTAFCTSEIRLRAQSSSSSHWSCPQWTAETLAFQNVDFCVLSGNIQPSRVPASAENEALLTRVSSQIWLNLSFSMQCHLLFSFSLQKLAPYEEKLE